MHTLLPHGLPKDFCLIEKECEHIQIPSYFSTLSMENWNSEIDVMKIPLSYILDLIDLNKHGQIRSIFKEDYEQVPEKYIKTFPQKTYIFNNLLEAHFLVAASKCKKSNDSSEARIYLRKTLSKKKECKVIEQILNILDEKKFLLQNISDANLTIEYDIAGNIWFPILKKVLFAEGNIVRIEVTESISKYSQEEKKL